MKYFKTLSAALLTASVAVATPASATPVDLTYVNQVGGTTIGGGAFNIDVTEVGGTVTERFMSWCIDVMQYIGGTHEYVRTEDNALTGGPGANNTAPAISNGEEEMLSRLFTRAVAGTGTAATNDAFQLAIWEIIYDGDSGMLDLTSGAFASSTVGANSTAAADAQALLTGLNSFNAGYQFTYYLSNGRQDQLVASAVPLPAGAVLLIGGLGALGIARRRRRAA